MSPGFPSLWLCALLACFVPAGCTPAASPVTQPVTFSVTVDAGFGNDIFVLGDHPDLGANDPVAARKLTYTAGNVWTGVIAVEVGTALSYKFIKRSVQRANYCNFATYTEVGPTQSLTVPAGTPAPYRGKSIWYHSSWNRAFLLYRNNTTGAAFTNVEMRLAGPGRTAAESLFRLDLPDDRAGSELEFVFHNENNQYDNAPAPPSNPAQGSAPSVPVPYQALVPPYNYRTALDHFFVQDGNVFNYAPPASVSPPRVETRSVGSSYAAIPVRTIRIYLPRGYDTNPARRYPVVYFHDGQNIFFPGGPFGTWDADRIGSYETGQGRMREAIVVGIDNTANRMGEYTPPTDPVATAPAQTGIADQYKLFVLNNVIPTISANYRTRTMASGAVDPAQTTIAGSSMGGLVSTYFALENPEYFSRAGVFSPAFWAAPAYATVRDSAPKKALKWWLSMGTQEGSSSQPDQDVYWNDAQRALNGWITNGYAQNTALLFTPGCGQVHNEGAWSRVLPAFLQFQLPPADEANELAVANVAAAFGVGSIDRAGGTANFSVTALRGATYSLTRTADLRIGPWTPVASASQTDQGWSTLTLLDPALPVGAPDLFWRAAVTTP